MLLMIPSQMEVAPRYKLLTLPKFLTLLISLTLLALPSVITQDSW